MPRSSAVLLAVLVSAVVATPAAARSFVVSKDGTNPSIAVDARGVTHIAWDVIGADRTSTTHYCRVPRKARRCAAGSERTFAPVPEARDFAGPRLFLTGPSGVAIFMSRCCAYAAAPDGQEYSESVHAVTSADGGATFGAPAWIGTQRPDLGGAFGGGAFFAFGTAAGGPAIQAAPLGGFEARENVVASTLAVYGGIGLSPKGNVAAFADGDRKLFAGTLGADPNASPVQFRRLGSGVDVRVAGGPKGVDVFYRTQGGQSRYVVRRIAGGKAGKAIGVSEAGYPIFGNLAQDGAGRIHAVWRGVRGLMYRRSAKSGRGFGKPRRIARGSAQFNLQVAANRKGTATIAYDSNGPGRVGGFTTG
jgi:hypothetical protein